MTMHIFVGTYKKYNEGSLFGKWLDLEDYNNKEEFLEACADLHKDEDDPEYMFQDHEGIPDGMVSECSVDEKCWDLIKAYDEHGEDEVNAYCACFEEWNDEDFQDRYRGKWDSWEDMAEELLEETGELGEIPERLRYYFDYGRYARDLRLGGDMVEHNGYFFWGH